MQKIDRLGWVGGISLQSYGWRIGIRTNDPAVLDRAYPCLPPGWEPSASPVVDRLYSLWVGSPSRDAKTRNYHLLYDGMRLAARTMDLDEVFTALESDVQLFVAEWARERLFVHAGVVGWRNRALVLPGSSQAGKSTLVAALLRAGASYYSDEYAVLDDKGLVHPYPRRLSLRQDHAKPIRHSAEELGGRTGAAPLPIGMVAVAIYQAGAPWRPRPLTQGKTVLELFNHTVPALRFPERAMQTLPLAAAAARAVKGLRGDADETARLLLRALAA